MNKEELKATVEEQEEIVRSLINYNQMLNKSQREVYFSLLNLFEERHFQFNLDDVRSGSAFSGSDEELEKILKELQEVEIAVPLGTAFPKIGFKNLLCKPIELYNFHTHTNEVTWYMFKGLPFSLFIEFLVSCLSEGQDYETALKNVHKVAENWV